MNASLIMCVCVCVLVASAQERRLSVLWLDCDAESIGTQLAPCDSSDSGRGAETYPGRPEDRAASQGQHKVKHRSSLDLVVCSRLLIVPGRHKISRANGSW